MTIIKASKQVVDDIKKWGFSEWGSLASITGVGLWIYDQLKKKK